MKLPLVLLVSLVFIRFGIGLSIENGYYQLEHRLNRSKQEMRQCWLHFLQPPRQLSIS
ncbi:hypothetical protein PRIPAC_96260 [Pristionchus pacificus]|uniref:Uncharacterized protein n=1 Tax=Pristionchus pacificus TaxID=54126 RepID=A0A2A6BIP4_PRIPA|nr:hypothetical protein PRIPAC_96260 [Pristionchus pacificus]|eukprot:PDM65805.1 hypothetical protein PRIPAC_45206 [Pristionchus pacificus]